MAEAKGIQHHLGTKKCLVGKKYVSSWKKLFSLYVAFQINWNIFLFVFCFLSISYQFLHYFTCFLKRH